MNEPIALSAFPSTLTLVNRPSGWGLDEDDVLAINAGLDTELFTDAVSTGEDFWQLVRYFALGSDPEIGF
jgi:hypothetical protein